MGSCFSCNGLARSPVAVRAVTCTVLMISDMDVVFSFLFMANLLKKGGLFHFFFAVICIGEVTYAFAVGVYGPMNKYRTMKLVKQLMKDSRDLFKLPGGRILDETYSVQQGGRGGKGRRFCDMEKSEQGLSDFKAGMASYGPEILALWSYCDAKNAKNVCERKHGVPFFRLANYYFMAAPTPRDLSGILNANAAYSFCTGVFQLGFGVYLVYLDGISQEVILPLGVSSLSLVLSALNIGLDFSQMLSDIDEEIRKRDKILQEGEEDLDRKRHEERDRHAKTVAEIEARYARLGDPLTIFNKSQKESEIERASTAYELAIKRANDDNLALLVGELENHRDRVAGIRNATTGKSRHECVAKNVLTDAQRYAARRRDWLNKIQELEDMFSGQKNKLDVNSDTFLTDMQNIVDKEKEKVDTMKRMMLADLERFDVHASV